MGFGARSLMGPLLAVNFVIFLIVLGLSGWSLDKYIDGEQHHHLGGNAATTYMLVFALIGGVIGACSVIAGYMHLQSWRHETFAGAASSSLVAYAVTALTFGVAIKEIITGGHRGRRLQTLEAFVIISTLTQLMYLILLHSGTDTYNSGYRSQGSGNEYGVAMVHEPLKTSTTPLSGVV